MSVIVRRGRSEEEIPEWKKRVVAELAELFRKYPVIGIADLTGMPTAQLQKIRKKFRRNVYFKVAKKRLILRAIERAGLEKEKFESYLQGSIMLLFTDMNPFRLARMIESEKIPVSAKPGQVADREIVIPEGDTGLQPGPILSTFGKLRIPYEIRKGTIYVKKDTVVAKPGDVISADLAGLLQNLGIQPFEVSLKIVAVYDRGVIIPRDELFVDLDAFKADVAEAAKAAILAAAELGLLFVPEALEIALTKAAAEARSVIAEAAILTPDTAEEAIAGALAREAALIAALGDKAAELGLEAPVAAAAPAAPAEEAGEEESKEEEEKEEEEGEVDIGEGLGGLFGF
ncbi:MAG: 50S ribosomal protein L10 [Desulfurococcales archaeon]|nr:50S ribosomal protein L10 [Desulfurococcales archaeon]